MKFTDPNGECAFLIFVGLSALMSAALSGSQPDGSFDWGEAGKGAFIGVAMPVGMMGSVLAPFSPALLGVSGALGSAALAGGAMFGSVTLTTGATSFATNGTFSPNLKAAGISAGITALFAGIEGGIKAANDNRNFWTGEKIEEWQPTPVVRLRMQTPKFKIELKFKTTLSKIKSLRTGSEFYFDGDNLYLIDVYSNGQSLRTIYQARSGSTNYSPIPAGDNYSVTYINPNYNTDLRYVRDGVGFFADIEPYQLSNGSFGFEIHPDGAIGGNWWINNGTGGCIGIQENATRLIQLRDFIQCHLQRYGEIPLRVYYH